MASSIKSGKALAVRSSSDVPTRLSPLHVAVWAGDVGLVKQILDTAPKCVDDRLKTFGSSVQLALALGDRQVAEQLIKHGANLLQRDAATRKTLAYILPLAMHDMDFVHDAYARLDSQLDDARLRRLPRLSGACMCGNCVDLSRAVRSNPVHCDSLMQRRWILYQTLNVRYNSNSKAGSLWLA